MEKISFKEINRLALPAILAGISEPLISLADTAIIGRLGTEELGGVGIATSFFMLVIWMLAQTKSAVSAIVSNYYGRDDVQAIKSLVPQSILLNLLLGGLFFAATIAFSTWIFGLYEARGPVLQYANEYYGWRSLCYPFTLATFGLFGVFRGLQNTTWAMQISLIGVVINIVLDIALVFGVPGVVPALGVKGAAIAALIASVIMFVLAIIYLYRKTPFRIHFGKSVHPELWKLARMSGELFVRTLALSMAHFLGARFATSYGPKFIAAHTIAINIWLFSAFFIDGYSSAGNAIAGRLFGAKDFKRLSLLTYDISKISFLIAAMLSVFYLTGYPFIGGLFSKDPAVIELFGTIFWIVIIAQPLNSIAFTYDGIFKGLGETKLLMYTLLGATLLGFVPVIFIGDHFGWGLYNVWAAFLVWMVGRSVPLVIRFRAKYRPTNQAQRT